MRKIIEDINTLSPIGFGCYRVSIKSPDHETAMKLAIDNGCNLIDTSANYTDGDSEKLVGKIVKGSDKPLFIVSKAGYIQGSNIELVEDKNLKEDIIDISDELKHSIHPDFLESQLIQSLDRMKIEQLDCLLLHNPEYYFEKNEDNEEYYARISKAFIWLEEQVSKGRIRFWGVSSNTLPLNNKNATDIDRLIQLANELNGKHHHMRFIQFPYNLIENTAKPNLIQKLKDNGIKSLANRPLNCFTEGRLIRLANYKNIFAPVSAGKAAEQMERCLDLIKNQFEEQNNPRTEQELIQIPLLKQILEVWATLPSQDAVDQVFMGHFFPFIANVYGRNLTANESQPFYDLYETASLLARQTQSMVAQDYIENNTDLEFSEEISKNIIKTYHEDGINHVLVGMRRKEYVKSLF